MEAFRRITEGMDTCFRPLELKDLRPGDQPVSWQVAVLEERNRLTRKNRAYDPREFNYDFGRAEPAEDARVAARSARILGGNKAVGKQS